MHLLRSLYAVRARALSHTLSGSAVANAPGEGGWYSRLNPEPIDVVKAWGLSYLEGTTLKYLSRWRYKNGLEDLYKARWFLDQLIAEEERHKDDTTAVPTT